MLWLTYLKIVNCYIHLPLSLLWFYILYIKYIAHILRVQYFLHFYQKHMFCSEKENTEYPALHTDDEIQHSENFHYW